MKLSGSYSEGPRARFAGKTQGGAPLGPAPNPHDFMHPIRTSLAILATALVAACATQPPEAPGRHLLVRDLSGKLVMQFDYTSDELCAKTSAAMRGTIYKAGCSTAPATEPMRAQATLRYTPPGVLVQGHYEDMASCRKLTSQMSAGVELVQPCNAK